MAARSSKQPVTVVTGGAGFLGSHLTDRLLAEGHRVIAIDNLITGHLTNIEHLAGNENYRFIKQDVTQYLFVPDEIDYVFHFASPASPIDYLELPIPTLKVGALGTHNTLGLAKAKKATFLLASTSECYGDPLVHPQKEDYWGNVNPIGPRGVYDEAKRFAEAMTMAYHRYHGIDTKIVRIFNTYGPRMRLRDGRVVPAFIGQALSGAAPHDLRRRHTDALVLLRLRFDRRHLPALAIGFPRAGQHRQPARDDDQTIRRGDHPHHRHEIGDRIQAAAGGRPEGAPARHRRARRKSSAGNRRWSSRKESRARSIISVNGSSARISAKVLDVAAFADRQCAVWLRNGRQAPSHSLLAFFVRFVSNDQAMDPKIALTILPFALANFGSARNRVSDFQLMRIIRDLPSP